MMLMMGGCGSQTRDAGLVGRDRECATIDDLLNAATQGESGSLVIRGDAGMGKTALLDYAAGQATRMPVLRVTGVEAESDLAFAGLHGLVWPIVDQLERLPGPQCGALAAALGLQRGEGPERFLVSAGVLSLLAGAAEARGRPARSEATSRMPVYGYEIDNDIPPYTAAGGVAAGASHVGAWFLNPVTPPLDANRQVLQDQEVGYVTPFARSGNPTTIARPYGRGLTQPTTPRKYRSSRPATRRS